MAVDLIEGTFAVRGCRDHPEKVTAVVTVADYHMRIDWVVTDTRVPAE